MYEIRKHKIEIRKQNLERRAAIPPEIRKSKDGKICRNILSSAAFRYADVVLLYYPVKGEVDILPLMEAAIAAGKKVAFPRCRAEVHSYTVIAHQVRKQDIFAKSEIRRGQTPAWVSFYLFLLVSRG